MALPFRLFVGGPVAGGQQWLSWVHVDDAVGAVVFALTHPLSGPVHVTAPEPARNAQFARLAGRILHRPSWLPLPRSLMTAVLGEQSTLVCDGQRAIPGQLLEQGYSYRYPTLEGALTQLLAH
jgi:NAD dependent epimerase/dehydratase family enzyme